MDPKYAKPNMAQMHMLSCQVCVPKSWSDAQAIAFAEKEYPCGTGNGWKVRKEGDELLHGDPERNQCTENPDHIHISLDA